MMAAGLGASDASLCAESAFPEPHRFLGNTGSSSARPTRTPSGWTRGRTARSNRPRYQGRLNRKIDGCPASVAAASPANAQPRGIAASRGYPGLLGSEVRSNP